MENDFIEIESKKIPMSVIKSYEVTTEQVKRTYTEKKKRNWFVRIILLFVSPGSQNEPKEVVVSRIIPCDVLIIRTVQGDEYRFSKNEYVFDLGEQVRKLDEYLKVKG